MAGGRPKNTQGGSVYFDSSKKRYIAQYYIVDNKTHTEKRAKKSFEKEEDAKELISILKPRNCHLNLIPVNPIKERNFEKPSKKAAENFKNALERSGINVTIRREMGRDIQAACGQLRRRYMTQNGETEG